MGDREHFRGGPVSKRMWDAELRFDRRSVSYTLECSIVDWDCGDLLLGWAVAGRYEIWAGQRRARHREAAEFGFGSSAFGAMNMDFGFEMTNLLRLR